MLSASIKYGTLYDGKEVSFHTAQKEPTSLNKTYCYEKLSDPHD
jgi:hypothetical protein